MSDHMELTPENEARLARYRAGAMSDDERAAFEREALADDVLSEVLYREVSLDAVVPAHAGDDALKRGQSPRRGRPGRGSVLDFPGARVLLPLAASAIIVSGIALWNARQREVAPAPDLLRGGNGVLELIEPRGVIAGPPAAFRWTRDPGAASYRVELYDQRATRVGTAVTTDTTLAAGRLTGTPLLTGEWRVVALGADGLERTAHARAAFGVRR